jgi:hypothetical protein
MEKIKGGKGLQNMQWINWSWIDIEVFADSSQLNTRWNRCAFQICS